MGSQGWYQGHLNYQTITRGFLELVQPTVSVWCSHYSLFIDQSYYHSPTKEQVAKSLKYLTKMYNRHSSEGCGSLVTLNMKLVILLYSICHSANPKLTDLIINHSFPPPPLNFLVLNGKDVKWFSLIQPLHNAVLTTNTVAVVEAILDYLYRNTTTFPAWTHIDESLGMRLESIHITSHHHVVSKSIIFQQ